MTDPIKSDPLVSSAPRTQDGLPTLAGVSLTKKIGQGGMGAVYAGFHEALDIKVAVKVLPSHLAEQNDSFIKRFIQEARTAAKIDHPNLIRVINVGEESGIYFLVMEYVEGYSAMDILEEKGTLAERQALEIVLGAAHGLKAAHDKHIIHRDMKPDNIMIRAEDGRVKVSDLGLAKAVGGDDSAADSAAEGMGLTASGAALGTPYYMPPEQAMDAKTVDHRADIYSLGATLYHMLAGTPPFQASSLLPLLMKIRDEPHPDIKQLRGDIQDVTKDIIDRCMRKNPDDRYQTMGDMIAALENALKNASGEGGGYGAAGTAIGTVTPDADPGYANTLATGVENDIGMAQTLSMGKTADYDPTAPTVKQSKMTSEQAKQLLEADQPRTAKDIAQAAAPESKMNSGVIIGIIGGALMLVAAIVGSAIYLSKKSSDKTPASAATTPDASGSNSGSNMSGSVTPISQSVTLTPDQKREWEQHVRAGEQAFKAGNYRDAANEYRAAKELKATSEIAKMLEKVEAKLADKISEQDDTRILADLQESMRQADAAIASRDKAKAETILGQIIIRSADKKNFASFSERAKKKLDNLDALIAAAGHPTASSAEKLEKQYRAALTEAMDLITAQDFQNAKFKLEALSDVSNLPADMPLTIKQELAKITNYLNKLDAGDKAVGALNFDAALSAYRDAAALYASDAVQGKISAATASKKRITAFRNDMNAVAASIQAEDYKAAFDAVSKLAHADGIPESMIANAQKHLAKLKSYLALMEEGDAMVNAGLYDKAGATYASAKKLYDSAAVRDSLRKANDLAANAKKKIKYSDTFNKAAAALKAGEINTAKFLFKAVADSDDAPADVKGQAGQSLDTIQKFQTLVQDADTLIGSGKYAAGIKKYEQAAGLYDVALVRDKISRAKAAQATHDAQVKALFDKLAAAKKSINAGDFDMAKKTLSEIVSASDAPVDVTTAARDEQDKIRQYQTLLFAGNAAMDVGNFDAAIEKLAAARKIYDTQVVKDKLAAAAKSKQSEAFCRKLLTDADTAIRDGHIEQAKGFLEQLTAIPDAPAAVLDNGKKKLADVSGYLNAMSESDAAFNAGKFDDALAACKRAAGFFDTPRSRERIKAIETRRAEDRLKVFRDAFDKVKANIVGGNIRSAETELKNLVADADAPDDIKREATDTLENVSVYLGLISDGNAAMAVGLYDNAVQKYTAAHQRINSEESLQLIKKATTAKKQAAESTSKKEKIAAYRKNYDTAIAALKSGDIATAKFTLQALSEAPDAPVDLLANSRKNLDAISRYDTFLKDGDTALGANDFNAAQTKYESAKALFDTKTVARKMENLAAAKAAYEKKQAQAAAAQKQAEAEKQARINALNDSLTRAEQDLAAGRIDAAKSAVDTILASEDAMADIQKKARGLNTRIDSALKDIADYKQYLDAYGSQFEQRALNKQTRYTEYEKRGAFLRKYPGHPLADRTRVAALVRSNTDGLDILLNGEVVSQINAAGETVVVLYDPRKPNTLTVVKQGLTPGTRAATLQNGLYLFPADPIMLTPKLKAKWSYSPDARPITGLCALNKSVFCGLEGGGILIVNPATDQAVVVAKKYGEVIAGPIAKNRSVFAILKNDTVTTFVQLDAAGTIKWSAATANVGDPIGRMVFVGDHGDYLVQAFSDKVLVASPSMDGSAPMGYDYPRNGRSGVAKVSKWIVGISLGNAIHFIDIAEAKTHQTNLGRFTTVGEMAGGNLLIFFDNGRGSINTYSLKTHKSRANRYPPRKIGELTQGDGFIYFVTNKKRAMGLRITDRPTRRKEAKLSDMPTGLITVTDNYLIIPTTMGKVDLVDIQSFETLPPFETPDGNRVTKAAAMIGNTVYLVSNVGTIYAVDIHR